MGVYVPWLAAAARMTGYPVVEVGGWRNRGHGPMRVVEGVVAHHTADGSRGDYPSLNIVTYGRAGLAGPLSQLGLGRTGRIFVIAAGQAWHAGASSWAGFWDLNDEFLGIEAESVGTYDDWTREQRDCYPRLVAALLHYMRRGSGRCGAHKEVCRPRGRKIDPAYWDMHAMRHQVQRYLDNPQSINRHWRPAPVSQPGGIETMAFTDKYRDWAGNEQTVQSWMNHVDRRSYENQQKLDHAIRRIDETANGIIDYWNQEAQRWTDLQARLDAIEATLDAHAGGEEVPKA